MRAEVRSSHCPIEHPSSLPHTPCFSAFHVLFLKSPYASQRCQSEENAGFIPRDTKLFIWVLC